MSLKVTCLKSILFTSVFTFSGLALADPVGESATFLLDSSSARTSNLIRTGKVIHAVDADNGSAYEVSMFCGFDVRFVGRLEGTSSTNYPYEVFSSEWMQNLRSGDVYEMPGMTVEHLGFGDVRLQTGETFDGSDKLHIYNIDTSNGCIQETLQGLGFDPAATDIEMNVMVANESYDVPVLGFVQIDLVVKKGNTTVNIGLDYTP